MRLKGYLHLHEGAIKTGIEIEELASLIKKECKPYLNIVKKLPYPFIRYMRTRKESDPFQTYGTGLMSVRQDREPKMTPKKMVVLINNWLEARGGARRDKSVIATSNRNSSLYRTFGSPHWIFPVGKFKYSFVTAGDWNLPESGWWEPRDFYDYLTGKSFKDSEDFEPFFYHNTHAEKAHQNMWEIWFQCKKYYFIGTNIQGTPKFVRKMNMIWEW